MHANIKVNLPAVEDTDDEQLNAMVCHELLHCVVNEMRWVNQAIEHEERVVTHLQKVMTWANSLVHLPDEEFQKISDTWQKSLTEGERL